MASKATKYGVAILAAVLMLTAFAGAASADTTYTYTSNQWNGLANKDVPTSGTVIITDGTEKIKPKFLGTTILTLTGDLTLDFSGFTGNFEGTTGGNYIGALFGYVKPDGHTLEIKGLNMTSVTVASSGKLVGGIIGLVNGDSKGGTLNLTNCHLKDCKVKSTGGYDVGGLVGQAYISSVNFTGCTVANSTITSEQHDVGGLLGWSGGTGSVSMDNCTVDNCTITGTSNVGGMVGKPQQAATLDNCSVEKSTITGTGDYIGGLVGNSNTEGNVKTITVTRCNVLDCTVKSTGGKDVGGMVGIAWYSIAKFTGCMVDNCTITGGANGEFSNVGGLIGRHTSSATISNCTVANCTSIKGTKGAVGGMVGYAKGKLETTDCSVVNCTSIEGGGNWIGGLAGVIDYGTDETDVTRCNVLDCTIKSTGGYDVGGLVGQAWNSIVNFTGCTVANSTITSANYYDVGGLVGFSGDTGSVTMDNCSVENCTMTGKKSGEFSDVGGLIGRHTSSADISNCTVANCPSITGTAGAVGGMVGFANGKLTTADCSVVNCTSIQGEGKWIGGLAGAIQYNNVAEVNVTRCNVLDCTVKSTGGKAVGGLVGQAYLSSVNFTGCTVANSTISSASYSVGGLVGEAYESSVNFTGCTVANSTITSAQYGAGGLLGYSDRAVTMDDCSVDNCKITGGKGSETGNSDVGGLIGWHISSANIKNCTVANCTEISGTGNNVGGMVGYAKGKLTLTNCSVVNCTSIQGKGKWIGGLVGGVKPESIQTHTFINCSVISCSITGTGVNIGGLIGNIDAESNVNEIIVTRCKVLDSKVESTDGYEVGGMIGQAWYASVNFTSCMVANSSITAPYSVGGLLGYAKNAVTINNSSVVNCSIKGNGSEYGVGGLVGNAGYTSGASGNMIVKDCKVLHCDVVNDGDSVGGMVGLEYDQESSFERCIVANSTIASTAKRCVGGLLGFSNKAVTLGNCSVENCAVTGVGKRENGNTEVGGLVGRAYSITRSTNCEVMNCVIAAGGKCVGGLFGLIANDAIDTGLISELQGCSVKNSTISGTKDGYGRAYAGGLVGYARAVTTAKTSDNKVEDCAVNGGEQHTGLVSGQIYSGASITCTANLNENFIYNNTGSYTDTITLRDKAGTTCLVDANFWKTIFDTYADPNTRTPAPVAAVVTHLGEYGKSGGYGFGSLPKYTVIYNDNGATSGTAPIDRNSPYASPYTIDVTVTVLDNTGSLAKTGHTFGGWNTKNDGTGTAYDPGSTFTIKADTTLYAKWDSDQYDVKFFMNGHGTQVENTTVAHGSTVAEPSPAPSAEGFTFNGWYNDTGLSTKYDFSTPVTANLNLYANWTVKTYTIANASSDLNKGTTAVNKTRAKYQESVKADAFPVSGYHFTDWTCVNITGSSNNPYIFTMPDKNVILTANFAGNITTVTYQNETDSTYDTIVYTFNESAALPNDPVKEGYTFNGWNITVGGHQYPFNGNETYFKNGRWVYPCANATDLTVQANWTANSHKVSIDTVSNGQVNAVPNGSVTEGTTVALSNASDSGYHFIRYDIYKTGEKGTKVDNSSNQFTMPGFSVNVSGIFVANVTHVGFNNGTGTQTIDNTFGTPTKMPATPTKEGFSFAGWNVSLGSGQWTDFNSSSYNKNGVWNYTGTNGSNLDVHANWTEIPTYTITTDTVNGTVTASKNAASAGETIHVDAVAATGYHFVDWNVTNATSKIDVDSEGNFTMPASNVNAGANFTANVTHVGFNNGTGTETIDNTFGTSTKMPATPTKEGFTFNGWNVSTGSGWADFNSSSYNKNGVWNYTGTNGSSLDVHANWTEIPTYTITTDTLNGTVTASKSEAVPGDKIHVVAGADTGYHFVDWNVTNATSKIDVDSEGNFTMPASNVNAGANFTANLTHVGFNNGTGTETIDNTFGTPTKMPATPTKEGFTFNGWNVSLGSGQWADFNSSSYNKNGVWNYTGTNGSSLDVRANWTKIPGYTITNTTVNGMVTASKNAASAGETIHVDAVADTGYHFVDWNVTNATSKIAVDENGNFTMPASNVNAGANFTANDYEITILPAEHGEAAANKTEGCHIHDTIKLTATPHAGYMFVSWNCTDTLNFTNSTANPYQFQMNATDLVIQPIFDITSIIVEPGQVANASLEPYNDCPNEVVFCRLDNETHDIRFIASSGDAGVPSSSSSGYQNMDIFATFQINRDGADTDTADIVLNITLDGSTNPDNIYLKHYNTTTNTWDASHIAPTARTDLGYNTYQYTFTTAEFSPFVVVSETKTPSPSYDGGSSHQTGHTQILPETVTPTAEPTAAPTGAPTAKPTTQPTQKSPTPFVGIIAGLGAALVIARLRK